MMVVYSGRYQRSKKDLRVVELIGHVLDVLDEPHGGVLVRVRGECFVARHLVQLLERIRAVLVVLPEYSPGLGFEGLHRIGQVLKAIRLDAEDGLQVLFRESDVIVGVVVRGVGILLRTRLSNDLLILFRWVLKGPAKHHVLEEVSEARLPRLELVPRARLNRNLERNDVRETGLEDNDLEAIRQGFFGGLEREDVTRIGRARHGSRADKGKAEQQ
jgi:hypothetical protein